MFEASERWRAAAAARRRLRRFRRRPRAGRWRCRRPGAASDRIWSQAVLAWALARKQQAGLRKAARKQEQRSSHCRYQHGGRAQGSGPAARPACLGYSMLRHGQSSRHRVQAPAQSARPEKALEDRPGPRRRRLHRRRLRDRRPARPRPARGQQHRQQLRRLRRHQRRLLRRRDARQRDHPRRDDAGAELARPLRARRPRPRQGPEAQLPRLPRQGRGAAAAQPRAAALAGPDRRALGDRPRRRPRRGAADRPLLGRRASPTTSRRCSRDARPGQRLPPARPRALPDRDRPRHLRADRLRRRRLGRRADLEGDPVLDRAADRLQAGRPERPPDGRRRHPLDHQRRHRGREGRQVHRRRQPAGPLRQRLREDDPDDHRQAASAASPTWACRRSPTRPSA